MGPTYTHGHHESVLRSHRWRTAENSAGYLIGSLHAGDDLLDVGCGPGTITWDLAARVAPGRVVGLDAAADVLDQARSPATADAGRARTADAGPSSTADGGPGRTAHGGPSFTVGDVYGLPFPDASFDVVHAHQVLQHLADPVAALGEMRRVLCPGGLLAVRDSDYGGFAWTPGSPALTRWLELYHQVTRRNGGEADAGRHLLGWVRRAGFDDAVATSSTWTFADPEGRRWWGGVWAERMVASRLAEQARDYGLADAAALEEIARAWRRWAEDDGGVFVVPHGEVLARR